MSFENVVCIDMSCLTMCKSCRTTDDCGLLHFDMLTRKPLSLGAGMHTTMYSSSI